MNCQLCGKPGSLVPYQGELWHTECLDGYIKVLQSINGDARGSEGEQVVVPELLASVGLL